MEERLQNSINFLRSAYLQAKQNVNPFPMDTDTLKMLFDLLKECEQEINFLKAMQLQTTKGMDELELGNIV